MMVTVGHRFPWLGALCGVIICCSFSTSAMMTEKEILEKIYLQTGGSNWNSSGGWLDTDNYCNWYGVICTTEQVAGHQKGAGDDDRDDAIGDDESTNSTVINANTDDAEEQTNANKTTTTAHDDATNDNTTTSSNPYGSVSGLLLDANDLKGTMPSEVFSLTNLWKLDVKGNPNLKVPLASIGNATKLQILILSDTNTTNSDLHGLGRESNLTQNLTILHMSRTGLTGPFPEELFALTSLNELLLGENAITGTLPKKIETWMHMERFDVMKNNFTGQLPSFRQMKQLRVLDLAANGWTGTLPASLSMQKELQVLSIYGLYGNGKLSGPMLDFANCSKLVELYLQDNKFTGTIPSTFFRYTEMKDHMVEINLARNKLNGSIPQELGDRFDRLTIEISGNMITEIPSSLCTKDQWMEGEVKAKGCDGIACPAGTYQTPFGRATKLLGDCKNCSGLTTSPYLGNTECPDSNQTTTSNGATGGRRNRLRKMHTTEST